jgi:lysophospholipase L1-like esterase
MYNQLVYTFMTDSKYQLIHFNHGLHGIHLSKKSYKSRMKKLLTKVAKDVKLLLATSTIVYREGNKRLDGAWMKRVRERNEAVQELALEIGCAVDDLYTVSASIPKEYRYVDGTHYLADGYAMLADVVAKKIREQFGE